MTLVVLKFLKELPFWIYLVVVSIIVAWFTYNKNINQAIQLGKTQVNDSSIIVLESQVKKVNKSDKEIDDLSASDVTNRLYELSGNSSSNMSSRIQTNDPKQGSSSLYESGVWESDFEEQQFSTGVDESLQISCKKDEKVILTQDPEFGTILSCLKK